MLLPVAVALVRLVQTTFCTPGPATCQSGSGLGDFAAPPTTMETVKTESATSDVTRRPLALRFVGSMRRITVPPWAIASEERGGAISGGMADYLTRQISSSHYHLEPSPARR